MMCGTHICSVTAHHCVLGGSLGQLLVEAGQTVKATKLYSARIVLVPFRVSDGLQRDLCTTAFKVSSFAYSA